MIPFVKPYISANEIADDIAFVSRAAEIRSLPQLLKVVLTSPSGLDLVNVGTDEPQAQHRNKPWFKTDDVGRDRGVYVWNEKSSAWENLCPVDAAVLLNTIRVKGVEVAAAADKAAREAKADADRSKEFAESAQAEATAASAAAESAKDAAEEAAAGSIQDTWFGYLVDIHVTGIAGAWVSPWVDFTPYLDTSKPMVGFITLSADNFPMLPFRHGIEVRNDGTAYAGKQLRVVGWNTFATPGEVDRIVSAMWMVKGIALP